jgi:thymidylate kinase
MKKRATRKNSLLIVFEGPDGVGKTTLARGLLRLLAAAGTSCNYFSFPGKEPGSLGNLVYNVHHDPTSYGLSSLTAAALQALHVAAHLEAIETKIVPALRSGNVVVLDRFWWSTVVYGSGNGASIDFLSDLVMAEKRFWQNIRPDIVFLIRRDDQVALTDDVYSQLEKSYLALMKEESKYYPTSVIDNDHDIDCTLRKIGSVIDNLFSSEVATRSALAKTCHVDAPDNHKGDRAQMALGILSSGTPGRQTHPSRTAPVIRSLPPAVPSVVYDTYWTFAAKRQDIFFNRYNGTTTPWTDDPILARHKFTNAYRASDRVSQYLIRNVIYKNGHSPEDTFFRILLFKLFNRIETWETLEDTVGEITYSDFSLSRYDRILKALMDDGKRIYSAAYIMPSSTRFGLEKKHQNHLRILELMMKSSAPSRVMESRSMRDVFEIMKSYPMIGDFLAYQYSIDINYSELTDFSENDFVVPGPGARNGIRKCFSDCGGLNEIDLIRLVTDRQELEFHRLGLSFQSLWGRCLHLIDCQNLFCEVDKYSRVAHPEIKGINDRTRIKQKFVPKTDAIRFWFPPKWGINGNIEAAQPKKE